ncbi:MAG: hypothetical protein M1834_008521 [Cirrosporium novae-zelandiae]|nr:MAG: hypothetical protein M1834_008521 [Cirrosporium novae-zelandiae]
MAPCEGHIDAHQPPPNLIRTLYKTYRKLKPADYESDANIIDLQKTLAGLKIIRTIPKDQLLDICSTFINNSGGGDNGILKDSKSFAASASDVHVYEHEALPEGEPSTLLSEHSAASSNLSFFSCAPDSAPLFIPKDTVHHKPINITEFLGKRFRWVTLGGQYDWTNKVYPPEEPPAFPEDIKQLLQRCFPDMRPEAAIVNSYSPGDTLSMHRDVSEYCDQGLISISLGCDALFIIGYECGEEDKSAEGQTIKKLVIRLHSGDTVYMTKKARFAWHGVPRIIPNTCPLWMEHWPASMGRSNYEAWRGWMSNKRINLNVRQMKE